jgi:hypothetical protein
MVRAKVENNPAGDRFAASGKPIILVQDRPPDVGKTF